MIISKNIPRVLSPDAATATYLQLKKTNFIIIINFKSNRIAEHVWNYPYDFPGKYRGDAALICHAIALRTALHNANNL